MHIILIIISLFYQASEEYWTKFTGEIADEDDHELQKADEPNDAESVADSEISPNRQSQSYDGPTLGAVKSLDLSSDIESKHSQGTDKSSPVKEGRLESTESQNSSSVILGTAKVVHKPDELLSKSNIEEKDIPATYNPTSLQRLRSTRKLHVKHRFEDKDDDDVPSCKFICHTFWAIQFQAVRAVFLNDESDEGFIRSLALSTSWNAQGGKSGAAFSKTQDGRFVVKCISRTELQMFLDIALEYFKYLADSYAFKKPTVLCKILGIYQVGYHNKATGKKIMEQVVVMENVFHDRNITRVFDLKGSSRARYTATEFTEDFDTALFKRRDARFNKSQIPRRQPNSQVLMDDNFMELTKGQPFPMKHLANIYLQKAVENDTDFLSFVNIVDYSILVGIDENNFEVVVGIIDYMRQYDIIKRVERMGKSVGMIAGQAEPTIIQPSQYKKRFRLAMERNFMAVPDKFDF